MAQEKKDKKEKFIQSEGHPEYNNVCFVDVGTGDQFFMRASMRSKETRMIDGVEYYIISRDLTSASHPAYTFKTKVIETGRQIKSFMERSRRRSAS